MQEVWLSEGEGSRNNEELKVLVRAGGLFVIVDARQVKSVNGNHRSFKCCIIKHFRQVGFWVTLAAPDRG